jgi:ketosteroid isomerase-like protein
VFLNQTMKQRLLLIITMCVTILSCNNKKNSIKANSYQMKVTVDTLKQVLDAFNRHDLDAIMGYFSEDCSFDFPKGPEPWGQRFIGKAQVREALAGRFKGIPDVHYGDDRHWVSAAGTQGVSEWILTGTTTTGIKLKVQGCDLWEFSNGKISRKNSYWKIIEPTAPSKGN